MVRLEGQAIGNLSTISLQNGLVFYKVWTSSLLQQNTGRLAQPVEQLTLNQRVTGSIPVSPICIVIRFSGRGAALGVRQKNGYGFYIRRLSILERVLF
jgi:hypothetical protein